MNESRRAELYAAYKEAANDPHFAISERSGCYDCGREYGDRFGFPDLVVPHDIWNKYISPTKNEGGLLCPSCMCKRASDAGLSEIPATFMSGPFSTQRAAR